MWWWPKRVKEPYEIIIFRDHNIGRLARGPKDRWIIRPLQPQLPHVGRIDVELPTKPGGQGRRQLRVDPDSQPTEFCRTAGGAAADHSGGQMWMVKAARGIQQGRADVVRLEVGIVLEDLLVRFAGGQEFKHVDHSDAHASNARPSATLLWVDRDSLEETGGTRGASHGILRCKPDSKVRGWVRAA